MLRAGILAIALIAFAAATSSCALIRPGGAATGRGVIVGRVMKLDSTALAGMLVTIDGVSVSTDSNGGFVMRQPPSRPQSMVLSREGYKEFELPALNLTAGDTIFFSAIIRSIEETPREVPLDSLCMVGHCMNPMTFLPRVPLVILDGVMQLQDNPSYGVMGGRPEPILVRGAIRRIEVVMGPAAAALYGPLASRGVVNLRTRK